MWEEFPTKSKYLLINVIFVKKKKKKTRFKLLNPCSLFIAVIFQIVATVIIAITNLLVTWDLADLLYDLLYDLLKKSLNKKN